jgi:hypothetical protein
VIVVKENNRTQPSVRAVGYVRVSTDEQVQGFSLEGQTERIQSYAESQDYSLERIYRDDGYSAKDLNRPESSDCWPMLLWARSMSSWFTSSTD